MDRHAEQAVAGFFHLAREIGKQKPVDKGPIWRRMMRRIRYDHLAARHLWDGQWG